MSYCFLYPKNNRSYTNIILNLQRIFKNQKKINLNGDKINTCKSKSKPRGYHLTKSFIAKNQIYG